MQFSVISSGSKANCTFVESGSTRILIDCGLSARQTERRLLELGIDPSSIEALVITHEHSDHINGIPVFSKKFKIPVYANEGTAEFIPARFALELFATGKPFCIGSLKINPFRIVHDAIDPVGFVIEAEGLKFTQATDLGKVTPLVVDAARGAHALVFESNHDIDLLYASDYPWDLKQRIHSSHGHLSNEASAELLTEVCHSDLLHIVLAHISENCNTPEIAVASAKQALAGILPPTLLCGSQRVSTGLLTVGEEQVISRTSDAAVNS